MVKRNARWKRTPSSPALLVGRRDELGWLDQILAGLDSGSARVVEIVGEPGIGKTRLLTELSARAAQDGRLVLSGRATELERAVPFGIIVDAIDDRLAMLDANGLAGVDPDSVGLLAAIFPSWSERASTGAGIAKAERYRLHRIMRVLLKALAEPHGLLVILDDLHWADPASLELLDHLFRHPPRAPVLIAVAYRPRQASARLLALSAAAGRAGLAERLELGPLTPEEADELLGREMSRSRRRAVYRESGGNPLYMEAFAAARASAHGHLRSGAGHVTIGELPLPVAAGLLSDFHALSPIGRLVAHTAAVLGDPFEPELVAEVAEISEAEALTGIDELLACDLVRPAESSRRFRYRHALLSNVGYETAGGGWRLGAHARAATALAARDASAVTRAYHLERAAHVGDEAAVAVLVEAAQMSMLGAPVTAAHWLRAALRLLPDRDETAPRRLELLVSLAQASALAGNLHESRDTFSKVLRLSPRDSIRCRAQAVERYAQVDRLLGRHAEARALLLDELTALPDQDTLEAASLKVGLASTIVQSGDPDPSWARQALAAVRRHHDRPLHVTALGILAMVDCTNGDVDEAAECVGEAACLVDQLPDQELVWRLTAIPWLAWTEMLLERYEDALAHLARGLALARDSGQAYVLAHLLVGMGITHMRVGQLSEAASYADDAVEVALLLASDELRTMALTVQSQVASLAGDPETGRATAEQAVRAAGAVKDPWWRHAQRVLAEARLVAGEPEGCAQAMVNAGAGPELTSIGVPLRNEVYEALVRAELAQGHLEAARCWAERAERVASTLGLAGQTGLALLARAQALLADDPCRAAEPALAAAAAFTDGGQRLYAGRARMLAGIALAAAGDRCRALAELDRAAALFDECGAHGLADQVAREQERLGLATRRGDQQARDDPEPEAARGDEAEPGEPAEPVSESQPTDATGHREADSVPTDPAPHRSPLHEPLTLPSGLSPATLDVVIGALDAAPGDLSALEVATTTALSRVTVRRYLQYLCKVGRAEVRLRRGRVGRPEHRYRLVR